MKSAIVALACVLLVAFGLGGGSPVTATAGTGDNVLEFDTMVGVSGPFLGPTNPINGVPGAGAAWSIERGRGELSSSGALEVEVEGLVLVSTGANPQTNFRAVVACRSIVNGQAANAQVVTGPFPATPTGDSRIEAQVSLPSPCFNPAIFVTTGAGDPARWFAVTGQ